MFEEKNKAKRRLARYSALALLAVFAAVMIATPGEAGTESASPDGAILLGEPPERPARPLHRGLDGQVSILVDEWLEQENGWNPFGGPSGATEVVDVVVLASRSHGSAVTALVSAFGGTGVSRHGDTVYATLPIGVLTALGREESVISIQASPIAMPQAVTGQGVGFVNAGEWHSAGFTGAGVKVAVIDTGFQGYLPLLGDELPAAVTVGQWGCGGNVQNGETHGTGVAEIVHEMAPEADLFLLCIGNSNDLASAVNYAVAQDIDIINFSVGFFNAGRGDGTGLLGPIVQTAHNAGILFVAAAGNHAQAHWMGTFSDSDADGWHNFASADETIQFTLASGQGTVAFLKWDDWSSPTNDYDLYLIRASDSTIVAGSENFQQGNPGETPTEALGYTNSGSAGTYHLTIRRYSGTGVPTMDLFVLGVATPIDHNVVTRSILDPATSPLVTAVGAVCWGTDAIKPYSSRGPNINGVIKPDLSGPDGVSGATYGATGNCDGGFRGTSASSPHVAGAAALLAQAYPSASKTELHNMLMGLTRDAGAAGADNTYGAGILHLSDTTDPVVTVPDNRVVQATGPDGAVVTYSVSASDDVGVLSGPACVPVSGSLFPLGVTTVTCEASDAFGKTGVASFTITVVDTTPPTVTVSEDLTVEATSDAGATVTFDPPSASDAVGVTVGPSCSPASGSVFPIGVTTVTCDASDAAGNSGEASFTITVVDTTLLRYAGANRFETAADVSKNDFPNPSEVSTVFVAIGHNFPDALAGSAAAAALGAPLLLVNSNSIPDVTAAELTRLDPDEVVVLGGEAVISPAVASALSGWGDLIRLAGSNRYATAAAISGFAFDDPLGVDEVIIATGANFPDALGGGPVANAVGGPVLLVPPTGTLPAAIAAELTRLAPLRITVLGGESAVSAGVFAQLQAYADTVVRKSGANRYATAIEASKHGFGSSVRVYVAVGTNFPDALAGAAAAGFYDAPVLLVPSHALPPEVAAEITRLGATTIIILGGTGVVSVAVETALKSLLGL